MCCTAEYASSLNVGSWIVFVCCAGEPAAATGQPGCLQGHQDVHQLTRCGPLQRLRHMADMRMHAQAVGDAPRLEATSAPASGNASQHVDQLIGREPGCDQLGCETVKPNSTVPHPQCMQDADVPLHACGLRVCVGWPVFTLWRWCAADSRAQEPVPEAQIMVLRTMESKAVCAVRCAVLQAALSQQAWASTMP
jgi:hypothetical protein